MLPFRVKRFFGTVVDMYGSLLAQTEGLEIVWQEGMRQPIDLLDANVRSVTVSWSDVQTLRANPGMLSTTLEIEFGEHVDLSELRFADKQQLKLSIAGRDVSRVDPFIEAVRQQKAGQRSLGQRSSATDELIGEMRDFL